MLFCQTPIYSTSRLSSEDYFGGLSPQVHLLSELVVPKPAQGFDLLEVVEMRKSDLTNFQVATSETARNINRRFVLNLIRRHEPISRADLARHSGLQRSAVSVITEQLIEERWVTEGANGHTPRGRKPRFLHLNKGRVGIMVIASRQTP